ncbi:MAG: DUF2938 family protein [bacterium]|nr:MAG: DUF2938 family protein [bacterium]
MSVEILIWGCLAGFAATATMDVFAALFNRVGLTAGAKGQWVGRWYLGMLQGRFIHSDIADFPEQTGEKQAALAGHYVIGAVLAVFYLSGALWLDVPPDSFVSAVGYGLATTIFPWLLVLPCLGFGVCGRKGPVELKLFRSSLMNHLSYGLGLWWTANVVPLG